jgi:hypothetical protein
MSPVFANVYLFLSASFAGKFGLLAMDFIDFEGFIFGQKIKYLSVETLIFTVVLAE